MAPHLSIEKTMGEIRKMIGSMVEEFREKNVAAQVQAVQAPLPPQSPRQQRTKRPILMREENGLEVEVFVVSANLGAAKKGHRIERMHGPNTERRAVCGFKFGLAQRISMRTASEIEADPEVHWCGRGNCATV